MKKSKLSVPVLIAFVCKFASVSTFAGGDRVRLECDGEGVGDISMDARFETRGT